jgi:hypothetical protein
MKSGRTDDAVHPASSGSNVSGVNEFPSAGGPMVMLMAVHLSIIVLDLIDGIAGLAERNQNRFGEMHAFLITFRDLIPRCAVSRSGVIDEGGFDGTGDNYETIFRHLGSPCFSVKRTTACGRMPW